MPTATTSTAEPTGPPCDPAANVVVDHVTDRLIGRALHNPEAAADLFEVAGKVTSNLAAAGQVIADDYIRRTEERLLAVARARLIEIVKVVEAVERLATFDDIDALPVIDADRQNVRYEVQTAWFEDSGWWLLQGALLTLSQRAEAIHGTTADGVPVLPLDELMAKVDQLLTGPLAGPIGGDR